MTGPFKMKGNPMLRNFGIGASPAKQESKTYKKSKEEGVYTKQGRSHTPGPVVGSVFDPTTEEIKGTAPKTSKKVGPEQSSKAIDKEREEYRAQKKKTGEFSEETSREYKEFAKADAYRKR